MESSAIWLGVSLIVAGIVHFACYAEMFKRMHRINSKEAWIGLLFWPAMLVYGAQYWTEVRTPYVGLIASMFAGMGLLVAFYV